MPNLDELQDHSLEAVKGYILNELERLSVNPNISYFTDNTNFEDRRELTAAINSLVMSREVIRYDCNFLKLRKK